MVQPRLIRFRDAPAYCGMDKNRFTAEIRPCLTEIPIGTQGIAFDRLEMDRVIDDYIARCGRSPKKKMENEVCLAVNEGAQAASYSGAASGTSIKGSTVADFAKAVKRATGQKPSATLRAGSRKSGKRPSMG